MHARDVEHTIPFLVQIWMYASPVAYPASYLAPRWRILWAINPMVSVAEGFRWALFGTKTVSGPMLIVSSTSALIIQNTGAYWFRHLEKTFADVL